MSAAKVFLIGCGGLLLAVVLAAALMFSWLVNMAQDPEGVRISTTSPLDVTVGETFELVVHVSNERTNKALTVSSIDISNQYLEGFIILSVVPEVKSSMHLSIDNSLSHSFDVTIAAGATETFTFTLRAEDAGIFRGNVDVCEGARFVSTTIQTAVKS